MKRKLATTRPSSRHSARIKVARIVSLLRRRYGSPDHNNKQDPLDELIFIILSQMTTHNSYERVYDRLRAAVGSWSAVTEMSVPSIRRLIKDAGLSRQKAPRIKAIVTRIKNDFGHVSLEALRFMRDDEAEAYLTTLPGVGIKTARCVLMYALGRPVLPVDTHVGRVARRLGLGQDDEDTDLHRSLAKAVAPRFRYTFHVNAIQLGRDTCRAIRPRCSECVVQAYCASVEFKSN